MDRSWRCVVVGAVLTAGCGAAASDDATSPSTTDATTADTRTDATTSDDGTGSTDGADDTGTSDGTADSIWEVRAHEFAVPAAETTYECFGLSVPVEQLGHMIGFEPIVDDTAVVHHMLLYQLAEPVADDDPCYPGPEPPYVVRWGWAPGVEPLQLPEEAGFLVGHTGAEVHFALQVHYNNPLLETDHVDSSGVRIHWTYDLRPQNAGVIAVGDVASLLIPPGEPAFETVHECSGEATELLMMGSSKVFGSWLHAHELGKSLWTEQFRDGVSIGELGRHDPYAFDAQRVEPLDGELRPGDALTTHCIFDSTRRDVWTIGGGDTDQEMCLNYLWIYPPQPNMLLCNGV